jgi:hypothetical protein
VMSENWAGVTFPANVILTIDPLVGSVSILGGGVHVGFGVGRGDGVGLDAGGAATVAVGGGLGVSVRYTVCMGLQSLSPRFVWACI